MALSRDPLAGTPYRKLRLLRAGGMSKVYEVEDGRGRVFALKLLRREFVTSHRSIERMRLEKEILRVANHPNVVRLRDAGATRAGLPYIVMDRLYGSTLQARVARGALPVLAAVRYVRQALEGLAAVHALGVVHRDIKPENLFLSRSSRQSPRVMLLDFGGAKILREIAHVELLSVAISTTEDEVIGTARYIAPEVLQGSLDQRADLYMMGHVLHTLVTGREPFHEIEDERELIAAQLAKTIDPPSPATIERVSIELFDLIHRVQAKDPAARPGTAQEFIAALGQFVAHHQRLQKQSAPGRTKRTLGVGEYAKLIAAMRAFPERSAAIREQYGLGSAHAWAKVQGWWEAQVQAQPHLAAKFDQLVERYYRRFMARRDENG